MPPYGGKLQTISENMSKMKRIELLMNILYYCNYMIFYKVQKGMDWLIFSILDNTCTRAFCKSNGYWKYVNSVKQMYNKSMWFSENKKKPPVNILSMADTGIILFICINSFTILIILLTILDAIALKTGIGVYDFFNNKMVLGLLIIILCIMIYFTYHVFIDKNDKYVSYFKKFRKQKIWKLFIWYILSYSISIACFFITLRFTLTE